MISRMLFAAGPATGKQTLMNGIIASHALGLYHDSEKVIFIDRGADYKKCAEQLNQVEYIDFSCGKNDLEFSAINEKANCIIINFPTDRSSDHVLMQYVIELCKRYQDRRLVLNEAWSFNINHQKQLVELCQDYVFATISADDVKEIPFFTKIEMSRI